MRCKRTSQGRFAKATTALFATLVCGVIFILCGLPVEAQNPDSTSGFSLSLNQHQFNFPAMNLWPATRQFDSKSSVNSTFSGINQDLTVDGLFDNLDILPGKAGDIGEKLNFGYQGWKLFSDTRESLQTIKEHPNDPGSDWERASIGLNFYSFFGTTELLPEAAGGFGTLGTVVKATAEATRSRVMQNRAENLVFTGGMPLDIQEMREKMSTYNGDFSIRGTHVAADGGWTLDHYSQHPFERDSLSYSWADTHVSNLHLNDGSFISGNFLRDVKYDERGGSLWNLYDPTSTTITRRSQDSYHIYFNGANWNNEYQETAGKSQSIKIQPSAVPTIASPKELPLPYEQSSLKRPPQIFPSVAPQRPPPQPDMPIGNNSREGSLPQVKGVLMPVNVTNRPIDIEKFLHD